MEKEIFIINLMITYLLAEQKYITKEGTKDFPVFYEYINKSFAITTDGKNYQNKKQCMSLCQKSKCSSVDVVKDGNQVKCSFYYDHGNLIVDPGKLHISRKSPSSRYCETYQDLCGECECYDTIDALDPYFCDCRKNQLQHQNLTHDCNTTDLQPLSVPTFYSVRPNGSEIVDVMCEVNKNISYQLLLVRSSNDQDIGPTFPPLFKDTINGFTDTSTYWVGLQNINIITRDHGYTLMIEFSDISLQHFIVKYEGFQILDDYSISYVHFRKTIGGEISNIFPTSGSSLIECTDGRSYWWGSCDTSNNFFNQEFPQWDSLLLRKIKLTLQRLPVNRLVSEKKPSSCSSIHQTYGPEKAFDGTLGHAASFISLQETNPWLQVDLLSLHNIGYIKIYHRSHKSYRIQMVTISVSYIANMVNDKQTCATFDKMIELIETHYCIDNLKGQYVRIAMGPFNTKNDHHLQFSEIQVYGWRW